MSNSVLITGGSGFLGIHLVRHFLALGWEVSILDLAPFHYPEAISVRCHQGDIRNPTDVMAAVEGTAAIVHAAAALPLYAAAEVRSTDVGGTATCLKVAQELGLERLVYISSTAVYGIPEHHPVLETDPLIGIGPYGQAKIAAEALCQKFRRQGMCVPILRPKSFVGRERLGIFGLLFDWAASGHHFPLPGGGNHLHQLLAVEDLCQAVQLALTLDSANANRTCNIGAAEFGTLRDDFQAVLDYAGFGKRVIPLPKYPSLFLLESAYHLNLSPVYPWVYKLLFVDSQVSIAQAQAHWGYRPAFANRDALLMNFEWFLGQREEVLRHSGVTHRHLWKQGVLALARAFF